MKIGLINERIYGLKWELAKKYPTLNPVQTIFHSKKLLDGA